MTSHGVGRWPLRYGAPLVIALTLLPFTVAFFKHFTTAPESGVRLFGVFPLAHAHEFALPLAILIMDVLAVRIAADFWAHRSALLLAMFLASQAVPMVSLYFDSRVADLGQIRVRNAEQLRVDPHEIAQAEHLYEVELARYMTLVDAAERDKDRLVARMRDIQSSIAATDARKRDALERLRFPNTLAERDAARVELDRLALEGDRGRSDLSDAQAKLEALIANAPAAPTLRVPHPIAAPLPPESDLAFVVRTMVSWDSLVALLVASMFGIFWLVVGYALARAEGSVSQKPQGLSRRTFALDGALTLCAALPETRQPGFADLIAARVRIEFEVHRSLAELSVHDMALEMAGEEVVHELQELASMKGAVAASEIASPARARLVALFDELIAGPMTMTPETSAHETQAMAS